MSEKNRQGKILLVLLSFFWISFGVSTKVFAAERTKIYDKSEFIKTEKRIFVPGDVIVKFKKNRIDLKANFSLSSQIRKLVFKWTNSYKTEDTLKNDNVLILKIKEGQKVDEVINALKSDKNVEYAEPNYYREPMSLGTDDTYSEKMWG